MDLSVVQQHFRFSTYGHEKTMLRVFVLFIVALNCLIKLVSSIVSPMSRMQGSHRHFFGTDDWAAALPCIVVIGEAVEAADLITQSIFNT